MIAVRPTQTEEERQTCFKIRYEVFVVGQDVPEDDEMDEFDDVVQHYIAFKGDEPVGTGRLRPIDDNFIKFERVAVLEKCRGMGVGRAIMEHMQQVRDAEYPNLLPKLHGQTKVSKFYESLGWQKCGEEFSECGILHYTFIRVPEEPAALPAASHPETPPYIRELLVGA